METVGPFRLVRELGRGAMGVVFEAFDPAIGRTVALKMIRSQPLAAADEEAELKLRFARECSAAGRLSHPNIVTIYQQGEHEGMQYLAMEYVAGASLEASLAPGTPLAPETALAILSQVAAALDYAHGEGVVHRDIKPANILVKPGGAVKLTDFGIAHINSQTVTRTGATMGTPAYMAPEQIMAKKVDGRADQYSLAVLAYQMLSGQRPFEAPSFEALFFKIVSEEPRPLDEVNPRVPRAAAAAVGRALSKHPGGRYPNCSEFVAGLRTALTAPETPATAPRSTAPPPAIVRRPSRWPLIAACAVLLVAAAVWLGYSLRPGANVETKKDSRTAEVEAPAPTDTATTRPAEKTEQEDTAPAPAPIVRTGQPWVNPKDGLTYIWIAPATFTMGCSPGDNECYDDEKPAHQVTITKGFRIGQTEVTQEAYERVTGKNPSHFKGPKLPVETVSWNEAQSYCQAVGMRLPTEAEWEYAARAGSTASRYGSLDAIAWYYGNSGHKTHEVAQKGANAYELYDMLGNVWEWVADRYADKYAGGSQTDPTGPASGQFRAQRGGSWYNVARGARASSRSWNEPGLRNYDIGLRCAGN